jgi:hypothetical protein
MTTPTTGDGKSRSSVTRWILIGAAVVIVVALALTFWPRGSATPTASHTTPANYHPTTSSTPTPQPSITPVPPSTSTTPPQSSAPFVPRASKPIALDKQSTIIDGLTVRITKLASVAGVGQGVGDVSGPSVQVTMTVTNSKKSTANLANVVVNAYSGKAHAPASSLPKPGGAPFPTSLAAGKTGTGVFVFSIPVSERNLVTITFDYSVKTSVIVFQGSAPTK